MTDTTKLPTLKHLMWSTPDDPNPTLNAPLPIGTMTAYVSTPLYDEDGNIVTGDFIMAAKNASSQVEAMYVAAGGVSVDGLTITLSARGILPGGIDYTVGDSDLEVDFNAGDTVFLPVSGVIQDMAEAAIKGQIATGGTGFTIGTEPGAGGETITLYRTTTEGVKLGFFRWYVTNGKTQYSNNGTDWVNTDDVTASDLAKVSAADTTPGYAGTKINAGDGLDQSIGTPAGDETVDLAVDVTDIIDTAAGLTETTNDIQINLATDPGLEFDGVNGIRAKVKAAGGITRDADGLSLTGLYAPTQTGIAGETITTGQAIAEIPYNCQWYNQLSFVVSNLGSSNTLRKYAMKIIPAKTVTGITRVSIATAEQVNASTNLGNLVISVQTDNAGQPSGTLVNANATSTTNQATQRTWNVTTTYRPFSFLGAFGLTKGTTYWLVIECSATDVANYLKLGNASSYDENYPTFTRLIYDLDAGTWGTSSTVLPLFFHFDNGATEVSLGSKLVPTDADFGRRTWNFVGIADAAYSATDEVTYYYEQVPVDDLGLTLEAGKDYYISTTAGELTTSVYGDQWVNTTPPTTFTYKIGRTTLNADGNVILNVNPGEKKVMIEANSIAGNTTRYYPYWFNAQCLNVTGGGGKAGDYGISHGRQMGSIKSCTYFMFENAGGTNAGATSSYVMYFTGGGQGGNGAATTTEIGLSFAYTISGTSTIGATIEVIG